MVDDIETVESVSSSLLFTVELESDAILTAIGSFGDTDVTGPVIGWVAFSWVCWIEITGTVLALVTVQVVCCTADVECCTADVECCTADVECCTADVVCCTVCCTADEVCCTAEVACCIVCCKDIGP